jgi:hypothetical protein
MVSGKQSDSKIDLPKISAGESWISADGFLIRTGWGALSSA